MFGTEATALAVSKTGAVFFGLAGDTSIACWSEYKSLKENNIVSNYRYSAAHCYRYFGNETFRSFAASDFEGLRDASVHQQHEG